MKGPNRNWITVVESLNGIDQRLGNTDFEHVVEEFNDISLNVVHACSPPYSFLEI